MNIRYICSQCGKGFKYNCHLKRHINGKLSCIKKKIFECEVCKSFFSTNQALKIHINKKKPCKLTNSKNDIIKYIIENYKYQMPAPNRGRKDI